MRRRTALLGVAAAVTAGAPSAAGTSAAPAAVVLQEGHVDVAARVVDGALRLQIKDGTAGAGAVVWREPADVVFHVRPAAATTVPPTPSLAFLGAPGAPTWLLPQVQRADLLWPGWNTEAIAPASLSGAVQWTLSSVEGPGTFALFVTRTFGVVDRLFDSGDGLPDTTAVPLGTHAHGTWAFSAPGRYRLAFSMRATASSGEQLEDEETLVVTVGDVDPQTGAPRPRGDDGGPSSPRGGDDPAADRRAAARARLRLGRLALRGRMLALRVRVGARSRVRVVVRPRAGGRALAASRPRAIAAGLRVLRVRLSRLPAPGRYRVLVRATPSGGRSEVRKATLRVRSDAKTTRRGGR